MKTELTKLPAESLTNKLRITCNEREGILSIRTCNDTTTYGEAVERGWTFGGILEGHFYCEKHSHDSVPLSVGAEGKQLIEFDPLDADWLNPFVEKPFYQWLKVNHAKAKKFHEHLIMYLKESRGIEFNKETMRLQTEFIRSVKYTYQHFFRELARGFL